MIHAYAISTERPAGAVNGILMLLLGMLLLIAGPVSEAQPVVYAGALYG